MSEFIITFVFHFMSASGGFILGVYLGKKSLEEAAKKATEDIEKTSKKQLKH